MKKVKKVNSTRRLAKPKGKKLRASTTSDILMAGFADPRKRRKAKIDPKWAKHYEKLMDLRDYLLNQRDQLAKEVNEERPHVGFHLADSGTDSFDRDFALSLLSSEHNALYEIEEALNRIRNGTYGVCELTGQAIPRPRLDAIPWTRFTVEAQRKLERDGAVPRARLGELGSLREASTPEPEENLDAEEKAADTPQENAT